MFRLIALLIGACLAVAGCSAELRGPLTTIVEQGDDEVSVNLNNDASVDIEFASDEAEEGALVATDFEEICRITKDIHVDAPASGNRSTSSSNGTMITVLGSRSQSLSSVNGKAVVTVTGAAVLHLTFPNGDIASVETNASAEKVEITIDDPDAISCEAV